MTGFMPQPAAVAGHAWTSRFPARTFLASMGPNLVCCDFECLVIDRNKYLMMMMVHSFMSRKVYFMPGKGQSIRQARVVSGFL